MLLRELTAGDLTLEPLTRAHAAAMFPLLADPGVFEFIDDQPPASVERLAARYAELEARLSQDGEVTWLNWVIRVPTKGLVGFVQASVFPDHRAEIAFVLGAAHRGHGFARAATAAMLEGLASAYGVRQIFATVDEANHRSLRLLSALNFVLADPRDCPHGDLKPSEVLFVREL